MSDEDFIEFNRQAEIAWANMCAIYQFKRPKPEHSSLKTQALTFERGNKNEL